MFTIIDSLKIWKIWNNFSCRKGSYKRYSYIRIPPTYNSYLSIYNKENKLKFQQKNVTLIQEVFQLNLKRFKGWSISNNMWKLISQKGTIEYCDCLQNRVRLWDLVQEALVKFKYSLKSIQSSLCMILYTWQQMRNCHLSCNVGQRSSSLSSYELLMVKGVTECNLTLSKFSWQFLCTCSLNWGKHLAVFIVLKLGVAVFIVSCGNSYCLHKLQRCVPVVNFNDCYPQRIVCQYIYVKGCMWGE